MEPWLKPMLCPQEAADEVPQGDDWIIERKLDGWRALMHRTDAGVRLYCGRDGSEYTGNVPYLEGVISRLPFDTLVDGELLSPQGFGHVQSVMRTNGEHEPTAGSPPLYLMLFDILRVQGQDVRSLEWRTRREMLVACAFTGPLVFTSEVFDAHESVHLDFLAEGCEGSVAKRVTSKYRSAQRSPDWTKIKPQESLEGIVRGFKPGTPGSEFADTLGALEFEVLDEDDAPTGVHSRAGSGMDRKTRDDIWRLRGDHLGRIIEVAHHGLGKDGVPRHPVFKRFREDKQPAPAPTPPKKRRATSNGRTHPRNYKRMLPDKLERSIREIEGQYGEGYDRAVNQHTGADNELRLAREAAREKGLTV